MNLCFLFLLYSIIVAINFIVSIVSFNSGYFHAHGLKYQSLLLPNGLWGSVWWTVMSHNDNGMLNMSGLVQHLEDILPIDEDGLYDVIIGDAIYSKNSSVIWSTKVPNNSSDTYKKFKLRLKSCRQPHELHYGSFFNYFHLFRKKKRRQGFIEMQRKHTALASLLFLHNCFVCLRGSSANSFFNSDHPTLDQYLPLDE